MSNLEEQQELIETLRFEPVTYRIELSGYGGETVMGTVSRECYDYFEQEGIDIDAYVADWDEELSVPEQYRPFDPGCWYDCDDIVHYNGVELYESCWLTVYDNNDDIVFQTNLDVGNLDAQDIELDPGEEYYVDNFDPGSVIFYGQSGEKGTFFVGDLYLTAPFDPKKLKLSYVDIEGQSLCNSVSYAGQEIEDQCCGDTVGKSTHYVLTLVE